MVSPERVELSSLAPEASTLSVELRGHALRLARKRIPRWPLGEQAGYGNMVKWPPCPDLHILFIKGCHMSEWFWIGPTVAAILTFLGYALFKYLQGEFNPALSINYRHCRVAISPGYSLIFVEVEAHNSAKVPVTVRYMEATLRRLSRYTDSEVEQLYAQSYPDDGSPVQAIPGSISLLLLDIGKKGRV